MLRLIGGKIQEIWKRFWIQLRISTDGSIDLTKIVCLSGLVGSANELNTEQEAEDVGIS